MLIRFTVAPCPRAAGRGRGLDIGLTHHTAGGELTPTLRLKRRVITEKYAAEIDALYAEGRTS